MAPINNDSDTMPFIFQDYLTAAQTRMEGAKYRLNPEPESQYKEPYLFGNYPTSEWTDTPPGRPPVGPQPPGTPFPKTDCSPMGTAIGGGALDPCNPSQSCGVWDFSCCSRINKFSTTNGAIKNVQHGVDDVCRVVACWDEGRGALQVFAEMDFGEVSDTAPVADATKCAGKGHDPGCQSCKECDAKFIRPVLSYSTRQMSCGGTQSLSVTGGGGGPYNWTLSGGGSLAKTKTAAGESNLYTAPASNANCTSNAFISVDVGACPVPECTADISSAVFNSSGTITLPSFSPGCTLLQAGDQIRISGTTNNNFTFLINSTATGGVFTISPNSTYSHSITNETSNATIHIPQKSQNGVGVSIAINCYSGADDAVRIVECHDNQLCFPGPPTASCTTSFWQAIFKCDDTANGHTANCSSQSKSTGTGSPIPCPGYCAGPPGGPIPPCSSLPQGTCCAPLGGTCDVRTTTMKTQGCCPLSLA